MEENKAHNKEHKKENKESLELKKKNLELTQNLNIANDKVLRLSAEIQNIGKRHAEERMNMAKYEGLELIKELLPVIDNFERSIEMDKSVNEKYLGGYKMIYTNMINILKKYGVEAIDCQDKPFDPNTMEAIMTEHVDGIEPNYVLIVLQKGYMYKDRLLRPAMVKVSN